MKASNFQVKKFLVNYCILMSLLIKDIVSICITQNLKNSELECLGYLPTL